MSVFATRSSSSGCPLRDLSDSDSFRPRQVWSIVPALGSEAPVGVGDNVFLVVLARS